VSHIAIWALSREPVSQPFGSCLNIRDQSPGIKLMTCIQKCMISVDGIYLLILFTFISYFNIVYYYFCLYIHL
jgi:hypothetical protein